MQEPFLDPSRPEGLGRVREYVLGWLERLDYGGKLERGWPAAELAAAIWDRVERDFRAHWAGPVVANRALAHLAATSMVEDYFAAYPARRAARYTVGGPLSDCGFRRCVLDFVHDLEEFDPGGAPERPEAAAAAFWDEVAERPERWGCLPARGPFVDDDARAREVALQTVRDYFAMLDRLRARDAAP